MPYSPTTWANQVTALNATHMNNIEAGVDAAPYGPDATSGDVAIADGVGGWTYSALTLSSIPVPTGNVNMNSHGFTNLASATADTSMTLNSGSGAVSGDLIVQTHSSESARFLFGSAGPPDTRGTLLFNHGDAVEVNSNFGVSTGRYLDIRHGSAATPDTTYAPTVKVSRTWAHAATHASGTNTTNSATINVVSTTGFASSGTAYLAASSGSVGVAFTYTGKTATSFTGCGNHAAASSGETIADFPIYSDAAENLASIVGITSAVNTSGVQSVGIYGGAIQDSTGASGGGVSPDAVGVYAHTRIIPGGTGIGAGLCSIASKADSSSTLTSQQVFVLNSGSDSSYSPSAVSDCAFWVVSSGSKRAGAGILFPRSSGNFDVGIGFMSGPSSGGAINTAAISDDSNSATSYVINGSHTTGIDLSGGTYSGKAIQLGNAQALAAKTSGGTAGNLLNVTATGSIVQLSSSTFGSIVIPNNISFGGYNTTASTAYALAHVTNGNVVSLGDPAVATQIAGTGVTCLNELTCNNGLAMNAQNITGLAQGEATGEAISFDQIFGSPSGSMAALLYPGLVNLQVFGPTASAAWIKPASGKAVAIIAMGAGGGGGGGVGGANSLYGGSGGGCGDFMVAYLPFDAMPSSVTVQVGAGGAGGAGSATTTGTAGSNGSRSTIFDTGNNTLVAPAGGGGGGGGTSAGAAGAAGAAGTATTYTGYTIASIETVAAAGAQSNITTNAVGGSAGAGGAGAGIKSDGTVAGSGGANSASAMAYAATAAAATAGAMGAVMGNLSQSYKTGTDIRFGGGGGAAGTAGTAGAGGVGRVGGGGGGGGSEPAGGTGGAGGAGGDGRLIVMVFN